MGEYLSFHRMENNYIYVILASFIIFIILHIFSLIYDNSIKDNNEEETIEYKENILMRIFLSYFIQSLYFIPELIIKRYSFSQKNKSLEIKYNYKFKDILIIIFIDIIILINAFIYELIQMEQNKALLPDISKNLFFLFIFIMTILLFKQNYYIHQYISISIIILLGTIKCILNYSN